MTPDKYIQLKPTREQVSSVSWMSTGHTFGLLLFTFLIAVNKLMNQEQHIAGNVTGNNHEPKSHPQPLMTLKSFKRQCVIYGESNCPSIPRAALLFTQIVSITVKQMHFLQRWGFWFFSLFSPVLILCLREENKTLQRLLGRFEA